MTKVKFVKKANMWASIRIVEDSKGKVKQEMKWFNTEEEAEDYLIKEND